MSDFDDHINDIKSKNIYDSSKSYVSNLKNIAKSMSIIGSINLLIYVIFTFLVQLYMSKGTHIFEGFRWYHHLIWIAIIFVQVIYILYIIIYPKNVDNLMDVTLYDIFTTEIIDRHGKMHWDRLFIIFKNLLKAILLEPLMEYILLILLMIIPWPFLKNVSYKHRLHIILMKVGLFNMIISLVCMDYSKLQVNTELEVPK